MNIIKYPARDSWEEIVKRPHLDVSQLNATVREVLQEGGARARALATATMQDVADAMKLL